MILIELPAPLRTLAQVKEPVWLSVERGTLSAVLDALEERYPMLKGTIRDQRTGLRRPFMRFFACEEDLSMEGPDVELPEAVVAGKEPLMVVGAIAGG